MLDTGRTAEAERTEQGSDAAAIDAELSALLLRHDLRQPLAALTVLVDAIARVDELPHEVVIALDLVQKNTAWMRRLIRGPEDEQRVRVLDLADAIAGPCGQRTRPASCRLTVERVDRAAVLVEPIGLERAARNLIANAERAASHGGLVEVRVLAERGHGVLQVEDNGPGFGHLAPEHGHGLVGVRRFAERFGGALDCGTSGLGGALVALRLPLARGW